MATLTLTKPQAALRHAKAQTKAAQSFVRRRRARAKLTQRRQATKGALVHRWIDDLAAAIQSTRDAGPPKKKSQTQPLWLQDEMVSLTAPLKIALIVCDSILRPYGAEDDDLDDGDLPDAPSFQTVAQAIGRAFSIAGRNSAGYRDRRLAKRQREQVGLELLQIAARVGLINPLKDPQARKTRRGDKRSEMQRAELSDEAQRDMAAIQTRLALADDLRTDQVLFTRPPPVVDITPNWRGWDETPQCESLPVIEALERAQNTGWRICEPILALAVGDRDPVAEVTRAGEALKRARAAKPGKTESGKAKRKGRLDQAKADLRYWLTVVQAVALRGKTFYFKCRLDYRGRLYQVGSLLGYTGGDDLARALLEFDQGQIVEPLGALLLSAHMTSMFGHGQSKRGLLERMQFALDVPKAMRRLNRGKLKPKEPWRFYAAVFAYEQFKARQPVHTPIVFDCTSSGLQIYAALMRDEALGARVNMWKDVPPTGNELKALRDINAEIGKAIKEPREIVKLLTNPQIYGAGVKRQAKVLAKERGHPTPTAKDKADAAKVRDKLLELAEAFAKLLDYLKRSARVFAEMGLPFSWTLADGFEVLQDSRVIKKTATSYWVPGLPKQITYTSHNPTEELDPEKQALQVGANYVHSFDAFYLRTVVRSCGQEGVQSFALAHDSFGVLPNDGWTLKRVISAAIKEVYSPDWLALHGEEWRRQRESFGPPDHPAVLTGGWLLGDVVE